MRTVVLSKESKIIDAEDASASSYYGVNYSPTNFYGFITKEASSREHFVVQSIHKLTQGDKLVVNNNSLYGLLTTLLSQGYDVFEFNTPKEFYAWILSTY